MSPKFEAQLHPELAKRVKYVLQDLIARGWTPVIPEIYGMYGTGYRSVKDQAKLKAKHPGRTSVKFSFHNVTDAEGNPQAMAVHITDKNMPKKPPKNHPFILDLEAISKRHGLVTGNSWKSPWDPFHVQLHENDDLKEVKRGGRPAYIKPQLALLPAHFKINPPTYYLPPRSIDNLMAGERFILQLTYPHNAAQQRFNNTRYNSFPHLRLSDED